MYDVEEDGSPSMVSVPLDEDDSQLPAYVEHDGTGTWILLLIFETLVIAWLESGIFRRFACDQSFEAKTYQFHTGIDLE